MFATSSKPLVPVRYAVPAVFFHWAIVLLIATAYAAIELEGFLPKGSAGRALSMSVHTWAGALVLVLAGPRLLWRVVRGAPAPEPGPRWIQRLGGAMHVLLYLFIFVQPVLGMLAFNAGGHLLTIPGLGIELPPLVAASKDLKDTLEDIHGTLGTAFYTVIGLHAIAALFHHYMLGDNTLRRMWR